MAGARRIAHRRDAEGGEGPLELGGELARSRLEAVGGVIGEHQFEDVPAQPPDPLAGGIEVLTRCDRRMAGGQHPAGAVRGLGHLHGAEPTGAVILQIVGLAEGGDEVPAPVPAHELENGLAGDDGEGLVVDVGGVFHVPDPW